MTPNRYWETENLAYTEKERKPLMCRSGQQFGECSAVLYEKPMNFFLLLVWVMIKSGCSSSWMTQELLTWLWLALVKFSSLSLSKEPVKVWGKKLGLHLGSLQYTWVSLLVLHGLSARGTPLSTAGYRSLGKPNKSDLSSSTMSQAVPHKLHVSRRAGENCLAFLYRNGQGSGESAVGEFAATGDQVRNLRALNCLLSYILDVILK